MGRHESTASVLDALEDDHIIRRGRELVTLFDSWQAMELGSKGDWHAWIGSAAEILRELTRDA
jgi:hypothetical protein